MYTFVHFHLARVFGGFSAFSAKLERVLAYQLNVFYLVQNLLQARGTCRLEFCRNGMLTLYGTLELPTETFIENLTVFHYQNGFHRRSIKLHDISQCTPKVIQNCSRVSLRRRSSI